MKIFVVSDTHGNIDEFISFAKKLDRPDLIIHLGDYSEDGYEIEKRMGIDTIVVKGNCDFLDKRKTKEEEILNLNGKRIFITHGHRYHVKIDILNLFYKAREEKADVVLFGHTHIPLIFEEKGILFMNPGSTSFPKGIEGKTFGFLDVGKQIERKIIKIK